MFVNLYIHVYVIHTCTAGPYSEPLIVYSTQLLVVRTFGIKVYTHITHIHVQRGHAVTGITTRFDSFVCFNGEVISSYILLVDATGG